MGKETIPAKARRTAEIPPFYATIDMALARGRMAEGELREGRLVRLADPLEIRIPDAYWMLVQPDSADRTGIKTFVNWLIGECAKPGAWSK